MAVTSTCVALEKNRIGLKMISGPAETPSDWITTSTPLRARLTVTISSASPAIFSSFGLSIGILRADRDSARTECPASRAAFTVSRPIPSARSDDQDFRHGVMLLVGLAWLIVMCNAGSRTARRAGRLHMKGRGRECAQVPTTRWGAAVAASVASGAAVRGRTHDRLGADITASARPVLDDKLLTEPFRHELGSSNA